MKRKAKQHSKFQPVFLLSHAQRTALWIALDTLSFTKPSINRGGSIIANGTTAKLSKLDNHERQAEIELSYLEVEVAVNALKIAVSYLDGNCNDFCTSDLLISRLPQELREYGPVIRNLQPLFKECIDAIERGI